MVCSTSMGMGGLLMVCHEYINGYGWPIDGV